MRGVDVNSLTSKLVKLELTSQLSAEQVGFLFQAFDAQSDIVELESFLATATAILALLGAVMNDALVEKNRAAKIAAEREKVGQGLLDSGSKPAGGSGAKAAQALAAQALSGTTVPASISAAKLGCGASNQTGKDSAKAPPPSFAALIDAGTVVPDEHDGPYALGSYHANVTGEHRGYKSQAGRDAWEATNKAIMARQTSWATIDFEAEDAVDPEFMFPYGNNNGNMGGGENMGKLRPVVIEAQEKMKAGYGAAFESARSKQGAAAAFDRVAALTEISGKVQQPGGALLDLVGLYKGALGAIGELWAYGQRAISASGEAGVTASWGIKKACRIWFKLHTKYGGDVSKVTDCARISLEFATAEGLERAAKFVLQSASTFKNRVDNPTDEGYRDLMFTVLIENHVCEVQLHLVEMIKAKKSGAGHKMYKVCRRVLRGPIVKENTYCLKVVGKELRGEGERNAQGLPEGRGTAVYADGDMYKGQWRAGKRHGQGKFTYATGDMYEGGYVEDKKHGHGKFSFSIGDVYEGKFVADLYHGRGKMTFADGDSYEGEYAEDKKHGKGTVTNPDGAVCLGRFEAGAPVGQAVKWSADRTEAWVLQAGEVVRGIPLDEAAKIAKRIGLRPP